MLRYLRPGPCSRLQYVLRNGSKEQYAEFVDEAEKVCRESGYYASTVRKSLRQLRAGDYVNQCCRYEDLSLALKKVYGEGVFEELNLFYNHVHLFQHLKKSA